MVSQFISELHRSISKDLFQVSLSSVRIIITLINFYIFLHICILPRDPHVVQQIIVVSNRTFFLNISRFPRILDDKERFIANYELFT